MTAEVVMRSRGGGKTTELIQAVIDFVALDAGDAVIVTHDWAWGSIVDEIRRMGLVGVRVIPECRLETLRGTREVLFIDNADLTEHGIWHPALRGREVRLVTASPR